MRTTEIAAPTDVRHLGALVGHPNQDRIIAVSTSVVFEDRSLPKTFWGVDEAAIDSGFQGHIYSRPNDIMVVRVPRNDGAVPQMVITAIRVNYEIWKSLTGLELASATSRLVLASDLARPATDFPKNLTWHRGSMLHAAAAQYSCKEGGLLAFVLNTRLAEALGFRDPGVSEVMDRARMTSLLMDKNVAMQALQDNGVDCAGTYPVNEYAELHRTTSRIPSSGRYVFKPAGGAAGIGVYGTLGGGAPLDVIISHIEGLKRVGKLPRRFQIQEFLCGSPFGVTAWFGNDQTFEILEIHRQDINDSGRFIGGRWAPTLQAEQMECAYSLCRQLAAVEQPSFSGLVCIDVVDRKVIEINPRLTASAPIAHILRRQDQIARWLGRDFRVDQIDLNTSLQIPYEFICNGMLRSLIEIIWKERGVLVLPQGLNPFGRSRCVFINDDRDGTAQRAFVRRMGELDAQCLPEEAGYQVTQSRGHWDDRL